MNALIRAGSTVRATIDTKYIAALSAYCEEHIWIKICPGFTMDRRTAFAA